MGRAAQAPAAQPFSVQGAGLHQRVRRSERSTRLSSGSTVLSVDGGLLVLDRDSGELVRTDRDGMPRERIVVGTHPTQMVLETVENRVWVADHEGDRIVGVALGKHDGGGLRIEKRLTVHAPWGLAMHPDGRRIYVTSSVEGSVRQIDTRVMKTTWERDIGPEPRALAVSPDGSRLMVGFLRLGATAELTLASDPAAVPNEVIYHTIDPVHAAGQTLNFAGEESLGFQFAGGLHNRSGAGVSADPGRDAGRSFARNNFAVAFLGPNLAVAPHQLSTPVAASATFEDSGGYGGGGTFSMPIQHRMSFIEGDAEHARVVDVEIALHQPRAMATSWMLALAR